MNKIKIFLLLFFTFLMLNNVNCQKVIEGTICSINNIDIKTYSSLAAYYNDSIIACDYTDSDGKFKIILPDTISYVKLKIYHSYYDITDTIVDLKYKDTISGKFYVGTKITKYDLLFNENDAKKDILNGNIKLYMLKTCEYNRKILDRITKKYGFRYVFISPEDINQNIIESAYSYNKVVLEYLNKINHDEWLKELHKKIDKKIEYKFYYNEDEWYKLLN